MNILLESEYFKEWWELSTLKESTKRGYIGQLKKFETFLIESGMEAPLDFDRFYFCEGSNDYEPINEKFIDEYISKLKENHSVHTIYSALSSLTSFFNFLQSIGMVQANPLKYYPNPFYRPTIRDRSLSRQECEAILAAADRMDSDFRRFFVLVLLMLTCGLRAQEIIQMRKSQIYFEFETIHVSRGQKTDVMSVQMTPLLTECMKDYLNHPCWKEWSNGRDRQVFFEDNKPLTYSRLSKIIQDICSEAGVTRKVTSHQFRHTMVALMADEGIDPMIIKRQTRHKRFSTLMRYMPPAHDLRSALERLDMEYDK